jgi:hypothetical protein
MELVQYAEIYTNPNFRGERLILPISRSIIQEEFYFGSIKMLSGLIVTLKNSPMLSLNYERKIYAYIL